MLESVWRKWNSPTLLVGMQACAATVKNIVEKKCMKTYGGSSEN